MEGKVYVDIEFEAKPGGEDESDEKEDSEGRCFDNTPSKKRSSRSSYDSRGPHNQQRMSRPLDHPAMQASLPYLHHHHLQLHLRRLLPLRQTMILSPSFLLSLVLQRLFNPLLPFFYQVWYKLKSECKREREREEEQHLAGVFITTQ